MKSLIKDTEKEFLVFQARLIKMIIRQRHIPECEAQVFTLRWIKRNALRVRLAYMSQS